VLEQYTHRLIERLDFEKRWVNSVLLISSSEVRITTISAMHQKGVEPISQTIVADETARGVS